MWEPDDAIVTRITPARDPYRDAYGLECYHIMAHIPKLGRDMVVNNCMISPVMLRDTGLSVEDFIRPDLEAWVKSQPEWWSDSPEPWKNV